MIARGIRRLPRAVVLLAFTSLFADISTEMLFPVLPLFVVGRLGAPASVVGVIEGVAQATQNIVQGASGRLADSLGRNKPLALAGYLIAALAKPTMGLAVAWPQVLAGRFADRLGTGIRSAPRDALIAGSVDASRRGAAFGFEGIGDNLGAVLGPLIAAALLYVLHADLRLVFAVALIPGLGAFLLVTFVAEPAADRGAPPSGGLRGLPAAYWRYLAAAAAFGLGNSSSAFIILRSADVGSPAEATVLVYAGVNLAAALASYPAGGLSDAWGRKRILLAAFGLFAFVYLGLAVSTAGALVGALFVLYGVYQGAFRAVGKALAIDLAPADLRASAVGLYGTTIGLTALVASIVAGQLWDRLGPPATFGYGAAWAAVGSVLLIALVPAASGDGARRRA